ncbi:MAG: hypothetical protein H6509_13885 [Bryobacterales bacterium]|nr:hypothetical protein [Bryobacterales bacterium]
MHLRIKSVLPLIAVGGGLISLVAGVRSILSGNTTTEGVVAIVLLLLLATSLGIALGIQGLSYGRASRYASSLPDLLLLLEKTWRNNPETLTGAQATEICDRAVDALAKIYGQIAGVRCHASIEILTPAGPEAAPLRRESGAYDVVNLSRDHSSQGAELGDRRRLRIDESSAYRQIFESTECGAYSFSDDAAVDDKLQTQDSTRPQHYRSSLMMKICQAELCRTGRQHAPIAFLWLRSPEPGVFDEVYDVEVMERMSRALAPIVTRCAQATKPTYDFRRPEAAAL